MNKAKLKSYAPQARKDFIAAVTARANLLGLSEKAGKLEVAASQPHGDATIIAGQAWPVKVHSQRQQLITRIQKDGFAQTMEAVAYTWFNRFAALRYMELHDYLGHGHRALSSLEGTLPDILTHAADLAQSGELPGLKPALVTEMTLAGNRDGELYRMLLVAQCNALSDAMPFLFERIDDETELLLPDNLLRTDSVIAKMVAAIDEEDWSQVEIIGWLYQFYISEKKDEVIGKVVKSEDIPAATQLFTPNWIVQYLVQNSVGRLWLMANSQSTLARQWPYYIQPAKQTPEVQPQLDVLIQTRMDEDGGSLNPETITVLDPACGSGHILVVAYEVLKAIYLERGYQPRTIPRLILEKNLYGLDIDDRAAQMAGFALLMKARADDRRLFNEPIKLNVLALQESKGLSLDELATHLAPFDVQRSNVTALLETFEQTKTFGSLIQIPDALETHLGALVQSLVKVQQSGDLYARAAADDLLPLVRQAKVMSMKFDAVVANPPYMGGNSMNKEIKAFSKATYPLGRFDLFAMFIERNTSLVRDGGFNAMVTMQSWMFASSFSELRHSLLTNETVISMAHLGPRGFPEISGEVVQTCAFVLHHARVRNFKPSFFRLVELAEDEKNQALLNRDNCYSDVPQEDFSRMPDSCFCYWASKRIFSLFGDNHKVGDFANPRTGMSTSDTARFVKIWHELDVQKIGFSLSQTEAADSSKKWFPYNKGGAYRKWYGNHDYVVNYGSNGTELKYWLVNNPNDPTTKSWARYIRSPEYYFQPSITWTKITSSNFSVRANGPGSIFSDASNGIFPLEEERLLYAGFLNSVVAGALLKCISPTLNIFSGDVARLPLIESFNQLIDACRETVGKCIEIAKVDWNSQEISWDFVSLPLVNEVNRGKDMKASWENRRKTAVDMILLMKKLEERNNIAFIDAYGLQDELSPEIPDSQITLTRADREKDCQRLISYAIGCMMGRYSLDAPGLIYAYSGNVGFDADRYATFPADADGIVPLTDELWFEDDAASRIREFLLAVWGADTLAENMVWLAESLGTKAGETPDETIRRYLADKFYKDHLQTYKKRPIYWLFSSGKQGAFQALVYLHRYHEGTLARLRAEYVVPLTGKIQSRIDMLQKDAEAASSTAARNKLAKEVEKLKRKHVELLAYDEHLRHHADMRITLDLDDGVKVNYGKFGDLLAEVKAVTGGAVDD